MWFLLFFASFVFPMEQPAPSVSGAKKYSCCPQKFGYHSVQMDPDIEGRENIHLSDFEESKECSDEAKVRIRNALFKRLMVDLSKSEDEHARESFAGLIERLQKGVIVMGEYYTHLTHKDICHRIFSHLPAHKDADCTQLVLQSGIVQLYFISTNISGCIHQLNTIMYEYLTDEREILFGASLDQEFAAIKPFPSLSALAAKTLNDHHMHANVPQHLQHLLLK